MKHHSPAKIRESSISYHNDSPTRIPNLPIRNHNSPRGKNSQYNEENMPQKKICINVGHGGMRPNTQGADL